MVKAEILKEICDLLLNEKSDESKKYAIEKYPFTALSKSNRSYTKYKMCRIFLRDGFIDRFTGDKLIFPGLLRIITLQIPEVFKYHPNWKMDETHSMYWELSPTIDHLLPVSRNGTNEEINLVTTSMLTNARKANWTIDELQWKLHPPSDIRLWDGLTKEFLLFLSKVPNLENKNKFLSEWKLSLLRAINDLKLNAIYNLK